jgi:subtilisin family serine protease
MVPRSRLRSSFGPNRPWITSAVSFALAATLVTPCTAMGPSTAVAAAASPVSAQSLSRLRAGIDYRANELLVRFRDSSAVVERNRAHAAANARVVRTFRTIDRLSLVEVPPSTSLQAALDTYSSNPAVEYAEPNYIVHADVIPDDQRFGDLWALNNTGQDGGVPDADIDAPEAWDVTTGSSSVVVGVIDTGIDYTHSDLVDNVFENSADCIDDGVDDDLDGYIDDCHGINALTGSGDPFDDNSHGTHVSGTIGARGNNFIGLTGINWDVRIVACKMLGVNGSGPISAALECFDYIADLHDRGVNIVATNNSWSSGFASEALRDAIDGQLQRGILTVAAAGNSGTDTPGFPASYYLPNVISVAATTRTDALASFSSFGHATVHLGAPGASVLSLVPGEGLGIKSGTSMAAPHVTGVAALLAADDPGRGWVDIKNRILAGGDPDPDLAETITSRRLNAYGALTCASSVVGSRLRPIRSITSGAVGIPITLAALHVDCGTPAGTVTVSVDPGNVTVVLEDDGLGTDQYAGDGIYSGAWTPVADGHYSVSFDGIDTVTVEVGSDAIVNPFPSQGALFGFDVVADDTGVLVGAPFDDAVGPDSGTAHLFDAATNQLLRTFVNPVAGTDDRFGWKVSMDASHVAVAAPQDDVAGEDSGAVYVFDRATGALVSTLLNPTPTSPDSNHAPRFGYTALAITGPFVAVSDPTADYGGPDYGAVYLFDTTSGSLVQTFVQPEPAQYGNDIGEALASDGTRLFVGAPVSSVVYVFDVDPLSTTFGDLLTTMSPPSSVAEGVYSHASGFGQSVSLNATHVLVGAPYAVLPLDPLTGARFSFSGAAYLYDAQTGDFVREYLPLQPNAFALFGWSVALGPDGDVIAGAPLLNEVALAGGSVYRFDAVSGRPRQLLFGPNPGASDFVGRSIAMSGTAAFVGAEADDSGALNSGAVHRFERPTLQDAQTCYKSRPAAGAPRFQKRATAITDPLGSIDATVVKPQEVCSRTDLGFVGIVDTDAQLTCYRTKDASSSPRFEARDVRMVNELGLEHLTLKKPERVCLSSGLDGNSASPAMPNYRCYKARWARRALKLRKREFHLADSLGARSYVIGSATRVCLHADVDGASAGSADNHLTCFKIRPAKGVAAFERQDVGMVDDFGSQQLTALKPRLLCVVSQLLDQPE